ncbi:alpha/beta fold hydrolase [Microbacterium sp. H1-D42]|uniref:alpha/beta fold hydrolase n=1 Tax=Microbacterium sp. H1-D42 TaxID=2925844 RepID=UPI001F52E823|nr:alpha/beta fold hydrolase [Microbacterium sp. H1-D42]UNK71051.1 alpha/beta hydrolase [Microbacterium sp. H1-D42]
MSILMNATAASIRLSSHIAPALGGRLALGTFFATDRMRVREDDWVTHRAARRDTIQVRGREVATYEWGTGTRAALLVHGWNGRASQFATLVRDLVGEGFRVVAFDAPAHGESPGRRTDVRDWVAAMRMLSDAEGPFELIVGHSFGAFATLAALRDGVDARRVVSIAGGGEVQAFHDQFLQMVGLPHAARAHFEASFYRRMHLSRDESDARYDSLVQPLPSQTELLIVHDRGDRGLEARNSEALHAAHPVQSRLLLTQGFGHNRVLNADPVLDAVLAFADAGLDGLRDPSEGALRAVR